MATPQNANPAIIKLTGVRLSYPQHLFKLSPAVDKNGKEQVPKFKCNFILDCKAHADLIKLIEQTEERVALDAFKKKVHLKHRVLRDGNEKPDTDGYGDGVMFLSASRKTRPVIVDGQLNPIVEADELFYAGCIVNANIEIYAWGPNVGGMGTSADLRSLQFAKGGEPFGASKINAEEEFTALNDKMDEF